MPGRQEGRDDVLSDREKKGALYYTLLYTRNIDEREFLGLPDTGMRVFFFFKYWFLAFDSADIEGLDGVSRWLTGIGDGWLLVGGRGGRGSESREGS